MNSLYLAHPYEWMAHYGIPGMKLGKRHCLTYLAELLWTSGTTKEAI